MYISDTVKNKENSLFSIKKGNVSIQTDNVSMQTADSENTKRKEAEEKLQKAQAGDSVTISAQGLGLSEKQKEADKDRQEAYEKLMYQEMAENAKKAAEAEGKGFKDMGKALEIARRILNGDIVPKEDEAFLMDYDSELYMRVKSMAKQKEDPEKYDTLLEEEEENDSDNTGSVRIKAGGGTAAESSVPDKEAESAAPENDTAG